LSLFQLYPITSPQEYEAADELLLLWRQNRKEKRQVGHCETMFNVDELRIIFGVGLVLSWPSGESKDEANPCDRRSVYPFKLSL
jgi:hypothetical protein